ncbi:DUF2130 domain-containing protein [Spiroplasma endosymbiont of Nebria brevicollis]|uniref:DUF2130 domain-containing protein n=1 Tax=Spiroplasma endosymbiont of Nebria brevicollis TaxID=3066284 RepID=UPI00313E732A
MAFKIMCPHCHKPITEKDFQENEQAIAHLQEFFNSQETKYKQELTDKLQSQWLTQQKAILEAQLKTQEAQLTKDQQKVVQQLHTEKQKELNNLNNKIQELVIENKNFEAELKTQLTAKELSVLKEKQTIIDTIKDQNIKKESELNLKIAELTLKLEQGRNIKSGILGSNLENDFERTMNTFYLSDNFEKTTKAINGRKPDFMLGITNPRNEKKEMGKILFELKNQEKLILSDVEDKLVKELKEWNGDFGLIIWAYAHAPFTHSKTHNNIFIVNTDFEILVLIVNVLKMLINKRFTLENQQQIKDQDEKMMEKFKSWMENDFNKLIGKVMGEFDKFDKSISDLGKTTANLTKIKDNLKTILTEKIENKLKTF